SEGWMTDVVKHTSTADSKLTSSNLANDDSVVRAQCAVTLNAVCVGVEENVMNDMKVLEGKEIDSRKTTGGQVIEKPVWGLDCWTRFNVEK
ncbi:hypothetical protein TL16_g13392, partial [Triparma laevis f. inornata]